MRILLSLTAAISLVCLLFFGARLIFPRPVKSTVAASGMDASLVYAIIKAESGFDENAISSAGAVGLMQLLPSTAEFICEREKIPYSEARLTEKEYNVRLGCLYFKYLLARFKAIETALAAYNAGEGVVSGWLKNKEFSEDGRTLKRIPYPETAQYVKKVKKFLKIYRFYYHESLTSVSK